MSLKEGTTKELGRGARKRALHQVTEILFLVVSSPKKKKKMSVTTTLSWITQTSPFHLDLNMHNSQSH